MKNPKILKEAIVVILVVIGIMIFA